MTIHHDEPCGCRYRQIDGPDGVAIGQGWELVRRCAEHSQQERQGR